MNEDLARRQAERRSRERSRCASSPLRASITSREDCDHAHWSFATHGRICSCGAMMLDFGD